MECGEGPTLLITSLEEVQGKCRFVAFAFVKEMPPSYIVVLLARNLSLRAHLCTVLAVANWLIHSVRAILIISTPSITIIYLVILKWEGASSLGGFGTYWLWAPH